MKICPDCGKPYQNLKRHVKGITAMCAQNQAERRCRETWERALAAGWDRVSQLYRTIERSECPYAMLEDKFHMEWEVEAFVSRYTKKPKPVPREISFVESKYAPKWALYIADCKPIASANRAEIIDILLDDYDTQRVILAIHTLGGKAGVLEYVKDFL